MHLPGNSDPFSIACAAFGLVAGGGVVVADALNSQHGFWIALAALIICATGLLWARLGVTAATLDRIRQSAYDDGYADGEMAQSAVPPLRSVHTPFSKRRPMQKLSQ